MKLPENIEKLVSGREYSLDDVGKSGSSVLIFSDIVLKVQEDNAFARQEETMLRWLQGKLPVPRVLSGAAENGSHFMVMEKCGGHMACSERFMYDPQRLIPLLAASLKALWAVPVDGCPCSAGLDRLLPLAARQVELGLVDIEDAQPDTFGPGGFSGPEELLRWLYDNRPEEEKVLCHGDFCLPNIFLNDNGPVGYIDLGHCGVGDPWLDIALCVRSLRANFAGEFGGGPFPPFDESAFYRALGIVPDPNKLRYYILLDELF